MSALAGHHHLFAATLVDALLSSTALRALAAIAALVEGGDACPSRDAIAAAIGTSPTHASRAIAALARGGSLAVERRRDGRGRFLPSGYRPTLPGGA